MPSVSLLAHAGLPFMNPLGEDDVDTAIAQLVLPDEARVVETGCGAADVLLRVLRRHVTARGIGVDPDEDALTRAAARAHELLPGREPELIAATADRAGLPAGSFDLVINVASSHAHGGYPEALAALAALATGGGAVLLGEGFWAREPSPAFLAALGGASADELPLGLAALEGAAREAGLEVVARATAGEDDWAAYEEGLARNAFALGTPAGDAYAQRIRDRRALPGGRDTLGFALLTLRRI